jgi:thioredoxin 1
MAIMEVDASDFNYELDMAFKRGDIVIIKFGSQYCDSCMALDFELEELDEKYDNLTILDIDTPSSEDLAEMYDIIEVPTMKIYKDEQTILFDGVGVVLAADLEKIIS